MTKEIQKSENKGLIKSTKGKLDLAGINNSALSASLGKLSIPRLYYQLVVFVLDGTGSMTWEGKSGKSKGGEVHDSIIKILERLDTSKNRKSFDIAAYAFAEEHQTILNPIQLCEFDFKNFNFDPTIHFPEKYKYEFLDDTLKEVNDTCNKYLEINKEKNSQALIIILSDGAIKHYDSALDYINEIKKNKKTTISSILLEDMRWMNDEDFKQKVRLKLEKFSSDNINGHNFFMSNVDPEEIRKHMIKSISTVSKID